MRSNDSAKCRVYEKISAIFPHQREILISPAKTHAFCPRTKWTIAMILQSLENLKRTAKVSAKGESVPSVDFGGNWSDDEGKKFSSFSRRFSRYKKFSR